MEKLNNTKPLRVLLDVFDQTNTAISLADLLEELQGKMNKTTVYRIVQKLENHQILHSFRGKDGLKWYAVCKQYSLTESTGSHPHFQCSECGKVECLTINIPTLSIPDYQIESAELLLVGQCKDCLAQ